MVNAEGLAIEPECNPETISMPSQCDCTANGMVNKEDGQLGRK